MKAVIDACVLYPTVLRRLVLGLADLGNVTPVWSERLLEEWRRTAFRRGGGTDLALAEAEIATLRARIPAAMTGGDPDVAARLWLPDPGDIHVLETAVIAEADAIITLNLKDFPKRELQPFGIEAQHPDAWSYGIWLETPDPVEALARDIHAEFEAARGEALSMRALFKRARLPRLAKAITSAS